MRNICVNCNLCLEWKRGDSDVVCDFVMSLYWIAICCEVRNKHISNIKPSPHCECYNHFECIIIKWHRLIIHNMPNQWITSHAVNINQVSTAGPQWKNMYPSLLSLLSCVPALTLQTSWRGYRERAKYQRIRHAGRWTSHCWLPHSFHPSPSEQSHCVPKTEINTNITTHSWDQIYLCILYFGWPLVNSVLTSLTIKLHVVHISIAAHAFECPCFLILIFLSWHVYVGLNWLSVLVNYAILTLGCSLWLSIKVVLVLIYACMCMCSDSDPVWVARDESTQEG